MPGTVITGGELQLAANEVIKGTKEILHPATTFSTSVSTQGMVAGDSTQVFVIGSSEEAKLFNAETNNYTTDNGGKHVWEKVTLDKHIKHSFVIEPAKLKRMGQEGLNEIYAEAAEKVAMKFMSIAFGLITSANFPNSKSVDDTLNFDKKDVGEIETAFAKLVGKSTGNNLILNLGYYDALRDSLSSLYAGPTNNDVLRGGVIPNVVGFSEVMRTTALSEVDTEAGEYLVGFATNKSGIALAAAPVDYTDAFQGEVAVSIEKDTGLPFTFSTHYVEKTRAYIGTVELLFGVSAVSKRGIYRLTRTVAGGGST